MYILLTFDKYLSLSEPFYFDQSKLITLYVTPNYEFAENWPKMMKKNNRAIIVFKNEKEILIGGKEFAEVEPKWKEIVKYYRNEKDFKEAGISKEKGRKFDKFKYIFGPITFDQKSAKTNPKQRENYYQLCLKDQDLAEYFYNYGENIEEVIFIHD